MIDVAGKIALNITFLSPITPNDIKRQSFIFSYINIEVISINSTTHDI